jgi:hypothetical protein
MSAISRFSCALGWNSPPEDESFLEDRPPQKPTDRRSSVRHPGFGKPAYLGWWKDGEVHTTAVQLRDISSEGAMVLTTHLPPDEHISLRQAEPVGARWCPARVVRVKENPVGLLEVGLALHAPSDSDLFKPEIT